MDRTPRRSIVMEDDLWGPLKDLAMRRRVSVGWLIRELVAAEIRSARERGEMPKRWRKK